ncbi:methyltransferase [Mycobacterium sp.]|uniref:methyltransferase n=1 Tax=Mycobacterium sp. TaxID=1785 RepID=UPI002D621F1F|nr:methyltransferase [Mycobacterium sp.]HZA09304.1 methyltransferase [Mycobacterium sp.]
MPQPQSDYALVVDPHREMTEMIFGFCVSQIVRTAAELSLADHLAAGPLSAQEIAEREGTAPGTTFRLMRACAAFGLLTTDDAGRFRGTALLDTLRTEAPRSLRALAIGLNNRASWLPWLKLGASVRTGHSQAHNALGMDFFDYLEHNPELAQEFTAGMSSGTSVWAPELAALIDTTNVRCAVDVGGAGGALLALLQKADPGLHGIVFDRPNIARDAEPDIARNGFAGRTEVVGGDFFDSVPSGDLYLLKFILHDWDDESCVKILRRCREAMEPGGRIAIIELVVGDNGEDSLAPLMDLNMLAVVNGRERSLPEFDALLHRAGLRRTAVLTADSPHSVIEAVAA